MRGDTGKVNMACSSDVSELSRKNWMYGRRAILSHRALSKKVTPHDQRCKHQRCQTVSFARADDTSKCWHLRVLPVTRKVCCKSITARRSDTAGLPWRSQMCPDP